MTRAKKPVKTIIDVRRPGEFEEGHAPGSINIPLQEMRQRLKEITSFKNPLVLVCGGGTRHEKAFDLLEENGIRAEKGGSWKEVKQ